MTRAAVGASVRAAALALLVAGCVTGGGDVHLEPLFARFVASDGARETEALFGLYHRRVGGTSRRHAGDRPAASRTTVGPLLGVDRDEEGGARSRWRFLVPFGYGLDRGDERQATLIPVFTWRSGPKPDGSRESFLFSLPGWIVRKNDREGTDFGWFPFWGDVRSVSVFDRLQFFLWPLWMRLDGGGSVGRHVLFPFFGWTRGTGKNGWHAWPFALRAWHEGAYDRWSFLWPVFHVQRNRLWERTPERKWMVLPLLGRTRAGNYTATSVLWPFFGWASDPVTGFWALDAPWPLVRLQTGPEDTKRRRFWPFFSYLHAGSLTAWDFAWPIVRRQREHYAKVDRASSFVLPFWQSFHEHDREQELESSWHKLWPLFQHEASGGWRRGSFPTLDPFQRNELVDRYYAWIWKLWEWEAQGEHRHERSWAGIVRRERDARETRTSLSGLWASRVRDEPGGRVRERSLLFGLLRWRVTEGRGFDMLAPAFPGPGWSPAWPQDDPSGEPGAP